MIRRTRNHGGALGTEKPGAPYEGIMFTNPVWGAFPQPERE